MKSALLQVADTGPLESLVVMLESVGYKCYLPNARLRDAIRTTGADTVIEIGELVKHWGYEKPLDLPEVGMDFMHRCDLYVDVKAQRNAEKIWKFWPRLKDRTLWYRINGAEPEIVPGCGDEINPPCPVLTPNLWYRKEGPWTGRAYACWPPFLRWGSYFEKNGREKFQFNPGVCLTHNLYGWGYHELIDRVSAMGVSCYGVRSPAGLVQHTEIPGILSKALCLVHLKDSDAPGYSLYESIAACCPLIVSNTLIWRNEMYDLFEPNVTCLTFGKPSHDSLDAEGVNRCEAEIRAAMERLRDPVENERLGLAVHERLKSVMWSPNKKQDVEGLADFMRRMFGE